MGWMWDVIEREKSTEVTPTISQIYKVLQKQKGQIFITKVLRPRLCCLHTALFISLPCTMPQVLSSSHFQLPLSSAEATFLFADLLCITIVISQL